MKIVHTSDWHIGRMLCGYSLLEDQSYFLEQLTGFLLEQKVDVLVVAGDLYDRAVPSAQAVALLDRFLTDIVLRHGIKVLAIAGNHDSPERLSFSNQFLEQSGLYLQGNIAQGVRRVELGGVCFFLLPYLEPAAVRALFSDETIRTYSQAAEVVFRRMIQGRLSGGVNILVAHGFFLNLSGAGEDSPVFSESELSVGGSDVINVNLFSEFDYIALGHLHAPQAAGENACYSGSPLKYSVSEAGQKKSVTLLEVGDGKVNLSTHSLKKLKDVRTMEGKLEELLQSPSPEYLFVNLTDGEYQLDAIGRLRAAFPSILGLQYSNIQYREVTAGSRAALEKSPLELFSEFYRQVTGEPATGEQRELVERLLEEIGGKDNENSAP